MVIVPPLIPAPPPRTTPMPVMFPLTVELANEHDPQLIPPPFPPNPDEPPLPLTFPLTVELTNEHDPQLIPPPFPPPPEILPVPEVLLLMVRFARVAVSA